MPVLFEVPRGWRPSLENGGLFHTGETWPQVEVMRCRVREEEMDRFQHQMEEQSHVGRGMETLMGNGGEGNKNHWVEVQ